MARQCIFCGGVPVSNEHLLAKEFTEILPSDPNGVFLREQWRPHPTTGEQVKVLEEDAGSPLHMPVKRVCRACNHGWMNDLDAPVKALVRRALNPNYSGRLGRPLQRSIAAWAAKVAVVAEYLSQGGTRTALSARREMHRTHLPPPGTQVWLGRSSAPLWQQRIRTTFLDLNSHGPTPEGFKADYSAHVSVLIVGPLLTLVWSSDLPATVTIGRNGIGKLLTPIWPNPDPVTWPMQGITEAQGHEITGLIPSALGKRFSITVS